MQKIRSEVKGQGPKLNLVVSGLQPQLEFTYGNKIMHKAEFCFGEMPYCLSRSSVKFQGHRANKNRRFGPKMGVSGLLLKFEFSDGFEMMHTAWCSTEEVPYCFTRSSKNFNGQQLLNSTQIERFQIIFAHAMCIYIT